MGPPDEQKDGPGDKREDGQDDERESEQEEKREGGRKEVREQLYEALSASDVKEKDYHVRQAIQLLQIED